MAKDFELLGQVAAEGGRELCLARKILASGERQLCVLKRLSRARSKDPNARKSLLEELELTLLLNHPNVVNAIESGEIDGEPYFALEFVDGITLRHFLNLSKPNPLPLSIVLEIGLRVASGLAHAHGLVGPDGKSRSIVHRDVSQESILISRLGQVKISDFALARLEGRPASKGPPRGKLSTMAPEQLRNQIADRRSDVFSTGVVLIELLTGQTLLPLGALEVDDLASLIRERVRALRPDAPADLVELLIRMTDLNAEQRPSSDAVVQGLRKLLEKSSAHRVRLSDFVQSHIFADLPTRAAPVESFGDGAVPELSAWATSSSTKAVDVEPQEEESDEEVSYSETVDRLIRKLLAQAPAASEASPAPCVYEHDAGPIEIRSGEVQLLPEERSYITELEDKDAEAQEIDETIRVVDDPSALRAALAQRARAESRVPKRKAQLETKVDRQDLRAKTMMVGEEEIIGESTADVQNIRKPNVLVDPTLLAQDLGLVAKAPLKEPARPSAPLARIEKPRKARAPLPVSPAELPQRRWLWLAAVLAVLLGIYALRFCATS